MENTLEYIKLHLKNVDRISIWVLYVIFPLAFSIIGIGLGIASNQLLVVVSLIVINIIMVLLLTILLAKNTDENLILCKALVSTDVCIVCLILAYWSLSYTRDVSLSFFVYGLVFYLLIVVVSIFNTRHKLLRSQGLVKKKTFGNYIALVLVGGVIGRGLGSVFLSGLDNSTVTSVLAIVLIIFGGIFATASHLYYCYFLMRNNKKFIEAMEGE